MIAEISSNSTKIHNQSLFESKLEKQRQLITGRRENENILQTILKICFYFRMFSCVDTKKSQFGLQHKSNK